MAATIAQTPHSVILATQGICSPTTPVCSNAPLRYLITTGHLAWPAALMAPIL